MSLHTIDVTISKNMEIKGEMIVDDEITFEPISSITSPSVPVGGAGGGAVGSSTSVSGSSDSGST